MQWKIELKTRAILLPTLLFAVQNPAQSEVGSCLGRAHYFKLKLYIKKSLRCEK
jgi:hypothetical protein